MKDVTSLFTITIRFQRQSITEDEWTAWKARAKKMLDDVQNGIISIEEYTQWMER